jgi:hypothetical protein
MGEEKLLDLFSLIQTVFVGRSGPLPLAKMICISGHDSLDLNCRAGHFAIFWRYRNAFF